MTNFAAVTESEVLQHLWLDGATLSLTQLDRATLCLTANVG